MKYSVSYLLLVTLLILAGCGGDSPDETPEVQASPTPQPTLTIEERIQFPAGLAENPLRMVIRPVDTVNRRVASILTEALNLRAAQTRPDASLTDVLEDEDRLSILNTALMRDFGVEVHADDAIQTVRDLIRSVQTQLGEQVSAAIFDRTSLYVNVVLVDDYGDALANLCGSGSGIVSISWLDGVTYQAATAQNCGQPALQVGVVDGFIESFGDNTDEVDGESTPEAEATPEATPETGDEDEPVEDTALVDTELRTGISGVLFTNRSFGSSSIGLVEDRVFCRLGVNDFYSWFLPTLVMEQNGLDPLRAPADIVDYDTADELVAAVESGACAMSGLPQDAYTALADDSLVIVNESTVFPYSILMYPLEVGLGVRLSIVENLITIADDPEDSRPLRLLLGQNAILPALPDDFEGLNAYLAATGYDFAQLGN